MMDWKPIDTAPDEGFILVGGWSDSGSPYHPDEWDVAAVWRGEDGWSEAVDYDGEELKITFNAVAWMHFPEAPNFAQSSRYIPTEADRKKGEELVRAYEKTVQPTVRETGS